MVAETSELAAKIIILNPIAQVIQDIRYCLITTDSMTMWGFLENPFLKLIPFLIVFGVLISGAVVFRKKSKFFAEEV